MTTLEVLKQTNRVVLVVAVAVVLSTVWSALRAQDTTLPTATITKPRLEAPSTLASHDLKEALATVSKRSLFTERRAPSPQDVAQRARRITIQDLVSPLQLVGTVAGRPPVAIVRNNNRTHTVRVGEFIGELEVVEIRETSVVFGFSDERLELSL